MPGHIVAVVGGKGGVGKSVFTANFAIAALQETKQRPLIVDLDLAAWGTKISSWDRTPRTIVDVSKIQGPIDVKALTPFMANTQAGYSFIGAPTRCRGRTRSGSSKVSVSF